MHRLDVVPGQAVITRHAAIKIDRAEELFKGRRLQDDVAATIGDDARAVEDDAVVAADEIDEDDGQARQFRPVRDHLAALPLFPLRAKR